MTYASLLAPICGRPADTGALKLAASLARACDALVTVLPAFPDFTSDLALAADLPMSPEAIEKLRELEQAWVELASDLARGAAKEAGLPFGGSRGAGIRVADKASARWLSLLAQTPLTDLAVLAWESARDPEALSGVLADLLFGLRSPVLVARDSRSPVDQLAAVAWDNSPECGRALRAALPLLRKAREVLVLHDPDGLSWVQREAADPSRLCDYLASHGLDGTRVQIVRGAKEGPVLLQAAQEADAALLVAGAYGHGRFQEWLFGGASRTFLNSPEGPHMLMAH